MPGTKVEPRQDRAPVLVPGMPQQRRRQSEAPLLRAARSARRNRHLTVPLAVPVTAWTAGEIMHAYGMAGYEGIAGLVLAGNVWFFAPHKWTDGKGSPRWAEVWYARATAVALWLWLLGAARFGASSGAAGIALGASLVTASAAWGVPWYLHKRPRGMKARERLLAGWQAWWDYHSPEWNLSGSRVTEAEEKGVVTRLRVQLWAGRQSYQHVKSAVYLIESASDGLADAGMVRVARVKGKPSQVDVFLKRENPLREVIAWDPALAPRSVHGDAVLGMSETGELVRAPMRTNAFVNGRTRSGKSNHLLLRVANLSGCPDDRQVVIDLKKRNARPLLKASAVDYVITDRDEARAWLRMLCAEIAARSRDWDTGEEQALATPSVPALHTLVDEVNPLTSETAGEAESARLLAIGVSQGSGLEVYYEVYTQYGALDESVRTEQTRMNLPLRACYATETADHGAFALGDGREGDTSTLEEKGEFLLKLGPKAKAEKIRAPHMPHSLLEQITAANAQSVRRPRLILFCGNEQSGIGGLTWQEWHDRRHLRIDPAFRGISPQYAEAVARFGEPPETAAAPAAAGAPPRDMDAAEAAAMIDAETDGEDIAPTAAAAAATEGAVARGKRRLCDLLAAAPPEGVRTGELVGESGMSRSAVAPLLRRLEGRGAAVQPAHGRWAPVPGVDVRGALRAVDAGDDVLLMDAKRAGRQAS
jgi:hypothetical protein